MAEKTLNSRIIHKHDEEKNWKLAVNFIPKIGEIIVYDADDSHLLPRIKIGDGTTKVNNLKFAYEPLTKADIEEICGAVFINATEATW